MSANEYSMAELTLADYDEVSAFWRGSEGVGLNECDEREPVANFLRRNPGLSLVVRANGEVIAAVLCGHDGRRGYLHHLAVAPAWRGRGLGRRLVERCLEQLAAAGIRKANIFLYVDNEEGERFWRALGFARRDDLAVLQRATERGAGVR